MWEGRKEGKEKKHLPGAGGHGEDREVGIVCFTSSRRSTRGSQNTGCLKCPNQNPSTRLLRSSQEHLGRTEKLSCPLIIMLNSSGLSLLAADRHCSFELMQDLKSYIWVAFSYQEEHS